MIRAALPSRAGALSVALFLFGCQSSDPGAPAEPVDDPAVTAPAPAADTAEPATEAGGMPSEVLGAYDTDADACARTTTMTQLTVSPDTLRFYYGYATVDSVRSTGDGYEVDATLYQLEGAVEVVPEAVTYGVELTDDGVLFTRGDLEPPEAERLVRCAGV